ncbi:MAG: gluconate 2-dehydrogenase subunit 3 family protein [Acidobacteria bacterium]|nr:gluconate 2-dehydrogenase subunit 3 family protein [Acidobacteriota bacterium]
MSKFTRRTLVQITAAPLAAQTHQHAGQAAAPHPRTVFFSLHEFETLQVLCDLILPADDVSPSASAAGAAEYIERLCANNARLARTFRAGLAWLNAKSGGSFAKLPSDGQTRLLDSICDRRAAKGPGVEFFDWARKMTVDAFYTHPAGYKDVEYKGGKGMTEFEVPSAALRQALAKAKLQ